jgi:hypothetical protein
MAQTNYSYSPINGELLGNYQASLDILATQDAGFDVYLVAANSTPVVPPATGPNQAAVFDPGLNTWSVSSDFRGYYWNIFTAAVTVITTLNTPQPPNTTNISPTSDGYVWDGFMWVRGLPLARLQKTYAMRAAYQTALSGTVASGGFNWNVSRDSLSQNLALYFYKDLLAVGTYDLIDATNTTRTVANAVAARAILTAIATVTKAAVLNFALKEVQIAAALTVPAVDAITW